MFLQRSKTGNDSPPFIVNDDLCTTGSSVAAMPAVTMDGDMAYVEVYDEPMHPTVLENEFVRVIKVDCPANESTMLHRHSESSFFLFFRSAKVRASLECLACCAGETEPQSRTITERTHRKP